MGGSAVEAWTDLNCVVFHGSEKARDMIIKHEFFFNVPNAKQACPKPHTANTALRVGS